MYEIRLTTTFEEWLDNLADMRAKQKIAQRLLRLQSGLFGDVKPIGQGLSEMRIDYGPGYRVYFVKAGSAILVILCGGDKSTQQRDIDRAKEIAFRLGDKS